jgi:protein PhnA
MADNVLAESTADIPACPICAMENTYPDGDNYVCADCGHEWSRAEKKRAADDSGGTRVRDVNGNTLANGDTVVVIKDLKVKGSSIPLKQGTVIKNIRLVDDDPEHIEGSSDKIKGLVLKVCFLKKA